MGAVEFLPWRVVFEFGGRVGSTAGRQGFLGQHNVDPAAAQPFVTPSMRPLKKSRCAKVKAMMPGATTTT